MIETLNFFKAFYEAIIWPSFFIGLYLMMIVQTLLNLRQPGRIIGLPRITIVGWLNILLFQFLFFRLARIVDEPYDDTKRVTLGWGILYFVWPVTGYGDWVYSYLFNYHGFLTIRKPKNHE